MHGSNLRGRDDPIQDKAGNIYIGVTVNFSGVFGTTGKKRGPLPEKVTPHKGWRKPHELGKHKGGKIITNLKEGDERRETAGHQRWRSKTGKGKSGLQERGYFSK